MSEKANAAKKAAKEAKKAEAARKAARKEKLRKWRPAIIAAAVLLVAGIGVLAKLAADRKKPAPAEEIYADIVIRDYGTVTVKLEPDSAPITVENFVTLAESGFYEGLTFHRIVEGFMMQGGAGTGAQTIKGEFSANGVENPLQHTRGAISMARTPVSYDSATSQFFICHQDSPHLNGQYACFGYVTEGMDVVDRICTEAQPIDDNGTIPEEQQPVIEKIVIRRTGGK